MVEMGHIYIYIHYSVYLFDKCVCLKTKVTPQPFQLVDFRSWRHSRTWEMSDIYSFFKNQIFWAMLGG